MSMKNSSDTIGNWTHDLPACSAVPQPTAPPAACPRKENVTEHKMCVLIFSTNFVRKLSHSKKNPASQILSQNYTGLHVKYLLLLSDVNITWILSTAVQEILRPMAVESFQADGETRRSQQSLFPVLRTSDTIEIWLLTDDEIRTYSFLPLISSNLQVTYNEEKIFCD